jgi:hypothetical protein
MIACPSCGSHEITRLPSNPHVRRAQVHAPLAESSQDADLEELLEGLRQIVEGSEDVGEQFPNEARRMHYMETPLRSIRGVATLDETAELLEEGVPVLPLPLAVKKGLH